MSPVDYTDCDRWIYQPIPPERPTEILLPVVLGIAPLWAWQEKRGVWCARLAVADFDVDVDCEHHHPTEAEAWTCAEGMARSIAERRLGVHNGATVNPSDNTPQGQ